MASITGKKTIFFVTSPRSPLKMVNDVRILVENFSEKKWSVKTQKTYYELLSSGKFYEGDKSSDSAFSARDRITRGPKSLGLVNLQPVISLTKAGKEFVYGPRTEEALLRQILKFQFPSPFHVDKAEKFFVKPYLELMRFINDLEGLTKTEIALFVVQLINYQDYGSIKNKIEQFRYKARMNREKHEVRYRKFIESQFKKEIYILYREEIGSGKISIRGTKEVTLDKFYRTKQSNYLDYADAAIRYLRSTGLFTFDPKRLRILVMPERKADVSFLLKSIERSPSHFESKDLYIEHLGQTSTPILFTDDKERIVRKISHYSRELTNQQLNKKSLSELKNLLLKLLQKRINTIINQQREKLRTYSEYEDVQRIFNQITNSEITDPSLFFEWNTWRAFEMLDDGEIEGKFRVDENGLPLYTAPGNSPDIVCKYKNFDTIVEVTISSGQRQYEMEGEPVARHFGNYRRQTKKTVFVIFIAPTLSSATLAHFFTQAKSEIVYYGGRVTIIPLKLESFKVLLENAKNALRPPNSKDIYELFTFLSELAIKVANENEWIARINEKVKVAFLP